MSTPPHVYGARAMLPVSKAVDLGAGRPSVLECRAWSGVGGDALAGVSAIGQSKRLQCMFLVN